MKEIIMQYNKDNSNIHRTMINLSRAFDQINHDVMIDKLLKSSLPKIIVRTIEYMLKNTYHGVSFNNQLKGYVKEELLFSCQGDNCYLILI